jgi:hypothetical protein
MRRAAIRRESGGNSGELEHSPAPVPVVTMFPPLQRACLSSDALMTIRAPAQAAAGASLSVRLEAAVLGSSP